MSEKNLIKSEILTAPDYYFAAQQKTLEARIKEIKIPQEEEAGIVAEKAAKTVRDKLLGLFKVGELISEILNWNESVDADLREAKKEFLLAQYVQASENNEIAISQLRDFLSSPQGNTLFNKIIRILDDSPPDLELANHLSSALQHIVSSDFIKLFEAHRYALAQIERLTAQALTILSDYRAWPQVKLGSFNASGSRVTSDWLMEFTGAYAQTKQISDTAMENRVRHSVNELISARFIEAHLVGEGGIAKCVVTEVGQTLLPYVNNA
ncbi:hypothetical protein [Desulfosudis oleivorans]|uniref:Uncharacterized protein n=1 Tax=Desulfosudis oleivorans (strain DSM 6200 / JCM 39069 / Hxd3) TaxID=96561 RepID=A8ZW00_DESOH|nr:hypothetical protein [Desulfosudis oleivorans]ABW66709.1 hypothetical protein Dole_0899 [Desulfosudis oleivorans Hxd3]